MTHIEVINANGHQAFKNGQLLKVVRETNCFYWVESHDGVQYQVSKRTKRINGTASGFIRPNQQPTVNL